MSESESSKLIPPYIPFDTFLGFIEFLKGATVPSRIDKSAMPGDLPSLVRGQIQSALRFLHLIDSAGTPDPKLRELVASFGTEKWKGCLSDTIMAAYAPLVGGMDLDSGTSHQLDEQFRAFYDSEQMRMKAMRFYLTAMTAASIKFSPHLMARRTSPAPRSRSVSKSSIKPASQTGQEKQRDQESNEHDDFVDFPIGIGRVIRVPKDLTVGDCTMIKAMVPVLEAYAARIGKEE
jgi:hypothetical protein